MEMPECDPPSRAIARYGGRRPATAGDGPCTKAIPIPSSKFQVPSSQFWKLGTGN